MKDLITKDTAISLGVVLLLCGGAFWAATVQSDISYMKKDLSYIRDKVETITSARTSLR
jgi:hypothetical protein